MQNCAGEAPIAELSHAGAVVERAIGHMLEKHIHPVTVASALLGGSLELLARSMDDREVLRVLDNAARCVRSGELRRVAARDSR